MLWLSIREPVHSPGVGRMVTSANPSQWYIHLKRLERHSEYSMRASMKKGRKKSRGFECPPVTPTSRARPVARGDGLSHARELAHEAEQEGEGVVSLDKGGVVILDCHQLSSIGIRYTNQSNGSAALVRTRHLLGAELGHVGEHNAMALERVDIDLVAAGPHPRHNAAAGLGQLLDGRRL